MKLAVIRWYGRNATVVNILCFVKCTITIQCLKLNSSCHCCNDYYYSNSWSMSDLLRFCYKFFFLFSLHSIKMASWRNVVVRALVVAIWSDLLRQSEQGCAFHDYFEELASNRCFVATSETLIGIHLFVASYCFVAFFVDCDMWLAHPEVGQPLQLDGLLRQDVVAEKQVVKEAKVHVFPW